jgi:Zn-dependent protease with chaperone function
MEPKKQVSPAEMLTMLFEFNRKRALRADKTGANIDYGLIGMPSSLMSLGEDSASVVESSSSSSSAKNVAAFNIFEEIRYNHSATKKARVNVS